MSSFYLKALVITLGLAGAVLSEAQSLGSPEATPRVNSPVTTLASSSHKLAPLLASDSARDSLTGGADRVVVATLSTSPEPAIAKAVNGQASVTGGTGLEEWMLVLIGVFLIGAVSQRRVRSMTN